NGPLVSKSDDQFKQTAQMAGLRVVDADEAPMVNVTKPILGLARELASLLKGEGLYVRSGHVVTIDADGEVEEMDPKRFVSWLPKFCVVSKGVDEDGKPRLVDLAEKRAAVILRS